MELFFHFQSLFFRSEWFFVSGRHRSNGKLTSQRCFDIESRWSLNRKVSAPHSVTRCFFFRLNCSNMIFLFHSSDSHKSREQVCKQRSTKHKAGFVRRKKFTRNLIAMRLPKPTMVVVGVWAAEKKTTLQVKRYALEERSSKAENNFKIDLVLIAFASAFYHCCPIQSRKNQKFSFLRIS